MKIKMLVENTALSSEYTCKHGLCMYIETKKHKLLFDLGPNGLFAENAEKMGIDIKEIDTVIISHGHKDHGGGLKEFLKLNSTARIYIRKQAFEPHYIKVLKIPFSVGLESDIMNNKQIVFTDEVLKIDEELTLFSKVNSDDYNAKSNKSLYEKNKGRYIHDSFLHEQNLIITEKGRKTLVSGCSHSGIVNIQKKAEKVGLGNMDYIIGGFHLYNPPTGKYESEEFIKEVSCKLKEKPGKYYTCHCTGEKAYNSMKEVLEERLEYLSTGTESELL